MNWLSILEASYIVYRLQPYYKNYKKRLSKRSKLYFYDTAIVCHLLGIESSDHLLIHSQQGAIFEGFIISEICKFYYAKGARPNCYFWREHSGHEIDLLLETNGNLLAFEIKSSATISEHFFKGLNHISKFIKDNLQTSVIYGGYKDMHFGQHRVISWQNLSTIWQEESSF